jgi:hypothetical protein
VLSTKLMDFRRSTICFMAMLLPLLCRLFSQVDHGLLSLARCSLLPLWDWSINRRSSIRPAFGFRSAPRISIALVQPASELVVFLENQLKRLADDGVAAIVDEAPVAVGHGQLILKKFHNDLLLSSFDALWYVGRHC